MAASASRNEVHKRLPYPEVWHCHEPARFPFGETPTTEALMSKEMSDDLAMGMAEINTTEPGWITRLFNFVFAWWKGNSGDWPTMKESPWKLPEVLDEEVERSFGRYHVSKSKHI